MEMIKNKSKKELIEMIYDQNVELQNLKECVKIQHDVITDVSDTYRDIKKGRWFDKIMKVLTLPFTLKKKLNNNEVYFYTYKLDKLTIMKESEILKSLDYINRYEDKAVSPVEYIKHIEQVANILVCESCGSSNDRLHNDFQRRIFNAVKASFRHLAFEVNFLSGKYKGNHYIDNVPFYTYYNLNKLKARMKKEIKNYKLRGILGQVEALQADLVTLENMIEMRKKSYLKVEEVETKVEERKGYVGHLSHLGGLLPEIKEVEEVEEGVTLIVNDDDDKADEKLLEAVKMYNDGVHPKTIASTLELEYKGLTGKIKDYIARNSNNVLDDLGL